jgi:hypothetical protein
MPALRADDVVAVLSPMTGDVSLRLLRARRTLLLGRYGDAGLKAREHTPHDVVGQLGIE